jgi:hypothetical protein
MTPDEKAEDWHMHMAAQQKEAPLSCWQILHHVLSEDARWDRTARTHRPKEHPLVESITSLVNRRARACMQPTSVHYTAPLEQTRRDYADCCAMKSLALVYLV